MTGKVQTVQGLIDPSDLERTLMHEHVAVDFTPTARRPEDAVEITLENRWQMDYEWIDAPGNRCLLDRDVAAREMIRMVKDGGQSVVEGSTYPMGNDPEGLYEVSKRSGVHIVSGVGRYLEEFMVEADWEMGVDGLVADFVSAIQKGYGDTAIRAGIIGEIGSSWPWTESERRSIDAAVIAQQETGAVLTIHPGRNPKRHSRSLSLSRWLAPTSRTPSWIILIADCLISTTCFASLNMGVS